MPLLKKNLFHPFLVAAYPVLFLLSANVDQVNPAVVLRPLLAALLVAGLVLALLRLLVRDWQRAAVLTSLAVLIFFSYGHVLSFLETHPLLGMNLGRHRYLLPAYLLLAAGLFISLLRMNPDRLAFLAASFTLAGAVMVAMTLLQTGLFLARTGTASAGRVQAAVAPLDSASRPDVYLIVLDGYARADVLQEDFHFDNQPFIGQLKNLGFQVASGSASNYNTTEFSLASMLNLDYLSTFGDQFAGDGADRYKIPALIKDNALRGYLEGAGYQTVAFETGYAFTDWWSNSIFLSPETSEAATLGSLRPFEAMLLKTTLFSALLDMQSKYLATPLQAVEFPYSGHIEQVRFTLDKLPYIPMMPGSKFTFAHVIVPHKPLVFRADGSVQTDTLYYANEGDPVDWQHFQQGYVEQVQFINTRMLAVVRSILASSKTPPVIVLMGDHGYYWGRTDYRNLLAVYLPGGKSPQWQDEISNVNIFRVVLNAVAGTQYPLLPDACLAEDVSTVGGFRAVDCDSAFSQ